MMKPKTLMIASLSFLSLLPSKGFSQWSISGNTLTGTGKLGSTSNHPLSVITNNTERMNIASSGTIKFNALSGTGTGIMTLNSTGEVARLGFNGVDANFLNGSGNFVSLSSATGWTWGTGLMYTSNKIGLGVSNPAQKLEVDGNAVFNGYVAAQQFLVSDIATVSGRLTMTNNMMIDGYDPIATTRNEVYTTTQPYYIQSASGYNNNTYINHNNTGKLGIGTNSPTAKMHILGTSKFEGEATFTDNVLFGDAILKKSNWGTVPVISSIGLNPLVDFNTSLWPSCVDSSTVNSVFNVDGFYTSSWDGAPRLIMGSNGYHSLIESVTANLELNNQCGNNILMCTGGVGSIYMTTHYSGKVGIGTTHPKAKLDIQTNPYHSIHFGNAFYSDLTYGTSYMGFNLSRDTTEWRTASDGYHNGGAVIYSNVLGDMFFSTIESDSSGSSPKTGITDATIHQADLYINAATGNVSIGTTCAPYGFKLAVDGRIICEEVKVKMSNGSGCWPDYVFLSNHNLPSITQVEQYILKEGHLSGFKTAKEIETNGVELSETIRMQQEKIEELTLYIIELNKRLEKLENK